MGRSGSMAAPPTVVARLLLLCVVVALLAIPSTAQNCGVTFSGNRRFATCNSLQRLGATLHWAYHPSNGTVDIAFRAPQDSGGWVAWGINPQGTRMLGTQALVALMNSSTNRVEVFTSLVNAYAPLQRSNISIPVSNPRAEYGSGAFTIYATLTLTDNQTAVNHVWQSSTVKTNGFPGGHPTGSGVANVQSFGTVDFSNGNSSTTSSDVVSPSPPPPPPSSTTPASPSPSNGCNSVSFSGNRRFTLCNSLQRLGATLHWTYHSTNRSVDIAFRAPQDSGGWVAWGINPQGTRMLGTQALVALMNSSTNRVEVFTSLVNAYAPLQRSNISIPVSNLQAEYSSGAFTIYATLRLSDGQTTVSHVWQSSTSLSGGLPSGHPTSGENVQSAGSLDLLTGESATVTSNVQRRRNRHGVLNAVSWGVLMPMGAIIARYLKVFKSVGPAWFYLHVACQCSAYIVGVAGWGTGLKLGSDSVSVKHTLHRNLGISLFALATLQVFALLLRPKPDHKYRIFWNVYHWSVGYAVIVLSIVNIFEGFDILEPAKKWKRIYVGILIGLGSVALVLEVFTWVVVLRRRARGGEKSQRGTSNGATNGYGTRQAV